MAETPLVGLIMGSRSDWETMQHAAETLRRSASRSSSVSSRPTGRPICSSIRRRGRGARPAGADRGGGRGRPPPGMAAAKTVLPVLGVPVESKTLKGIDSLLSIVQMPAGIPVGTLAIGRAGAVNAALLAAAILARSDDGAFVSALAAFRAAQTQSVLDAPDPAA